MMGYGWRVIKNYERMFEAGEQFIVNPAQAEEMREAESQGLLELFPIQIMVVDSPKYVDQVLNGYKVRLLNDGVKSVTPDHDFVWSYRVVNVFNRCGARHHLVVTNGHKTTPVMAKGLRHPMQVAHPNTPIAVKSVIISEWNDMYWGSLCQYEFGDDERKLK